MAMDAILERPKPEDCCGSGCNPCIFDIYEQKLQTAAKTLNEGPSVFNDLKYNPFCVIQIAAIAPDLKIYTFQAVDNDFLPITRNISFKMGDYIIMKGVFKDEQISRPYTPILNNELANGQFQVIVRLYENGKMSSVFKKLIVGDPTYWRGPYQKLKLKKTKNLILLGAGTGIVPLYNIAKEKICDDEDETLIKFIGCFKKIELIFLRKELQTLRGYWNFSSEYYISEYTNERIWYDEKLQFLKLDEIIVKNMLSKFDTSDLFVVICGPEAFNCKFNELFRIHGLHENIQVL